MFWDDDILPLFNCRRGEFVQEIRFADQIPQKPVVFVEVQRLTEDFRVYRVEPYSQQPIRIY